MRCLLAVLVSVAGLTVAPCARAEDVPIPDGTRVRLTSMGAAGVSGTVQGTLVRLAPGTLGVVDEERGAAVTVPDATVIRIQTSPGPKRHARNGFIIGAVSGATMGIALTSGHYANCSPEPLRLCALHGRR